MSSSFLKFQGVLNGIFGIEESTAENNNIYFKAILIYIDSLIQYKDNVTNSFGMSSIIQIFLFDLRKDFPNYVHKTTFLSQYKLYRDILNLTCFWNENNPKPTQLSIKDIKVSDKFWIFFKSSLPENDYNWIFHKLIEDELTRIKEKLSLGSKRCPICLSISNVINIIKNHYCCNNCLPTNPNSVFPCRICEQII